MPPLVAGPLAGYQVSTDSAFESEAAQKSGKGIAPLDAKSWYSNRRVQLGTQYQSHSTLTARRRRLPGGSPVSSALVDPKTCGLEKEREGDVGRSYPDVSLRCHHRVHCPWKECRKSKGGMGRVLQPLSRAMSNVSASKGSSLTSPTTPLEEKLISCPWVNLRNPLTFHFRS